MAVHIARLCSFLCPTKVPPQTLAHDSGSSRGDRNQHLIRTSLPTSLGYVSPKDYAEDPTLPEPPDFVGQFKCMRFESPTTSPLLDTGMPITGTGTHDPTSYLSIGPGSFHTVRSVRVLTRCSVHTALDFREWLGGEVEINRYCRDLVIKGSKRLAVMLGTEEMDVTPNRELTLNMASNKTACHDKGWY